MRTTTGGPVSGTGPSSNALRRQSVGLLLRQALPVLLAVVPLLALMLWNHSEDRHKAALAAMENALRLARLAAGDQGRLVESTRHLLIALSESPTVIDMEPSPCSQLFSELLDQMPPYQNLSVADLQGNVFCSAVPLTVNVNVKDRPAFQGTVRTRDFTTGDYRINAITGQPSLTFGYPVLDDAGQVRAVIAAAMDLSWLGKFAASAQLPEGSTVTLTDSDGVVLARYPDDVAWRGQIVDVSPLEPSNGHGEGTYEATGLDGVDRFYGFAPLQYLSSVDIFVRVGIPRDAALAGSSLTLERNLLVLGTVALFALALAGLGSQLLVLRPVNSILRAVKGLNDGNLTLRVGHEVPSGPLGYLAQSLDRAAESLQASQEETRRTLDALAVHTARAEALARESGRLSSHLELSKVLRVVCEGATALLHVQAASICLREKMSDTLHNVCNCGLSEELCHQMQSVPRAFHEHCVAGNDSVTIRHTDAHPELPHASLYAKLGIGQIVSAPLLQENLLIGVLNLYVFGAKRAFSQDELNHLDAFADQASLAIANARLYDSLRQEQQTSARLLQGTIAAQEEGRKRIARELHDETIQGLIGLILNLDTMALESAAWGQGQPHALNTARSAAQDTLEGVRRIIADLRPSLLDDLGLIPAIAWYADKLLEPIGIVAQVSCNVEDVRLPQACETALFRIAQEAINNVVKHSNASYARVDLRVSDGTAVLRIVDDGDGFTPAAVDEATKVGGMGLGLQGIRERVSMLGGQFSVETAQGQGTTIEVKVPLAKGD